MDQAVFQELKKSKLILEAIKKYGPMDLETLQVVVPQIRRKTNFRRTLRGLLKRKLIEKWVELKSGNTKAYYQFRENLKIREAIATYLNCNLKDLDTKRYRNVGIHHEQISTQICYHLEKMFPKALVLRDFDLHKNIEARKVLPNLTDLNELRPDVLLLIPSTDNSRIISIAFEFEKIQKSINRIYNKLQHYTKNTHLDGVVYINSIERISDLVEDVFDSQVLESSIRIKQYGANFLLTTPLISTVEKSLRILRNARGHYYSSAHYISVLREFGISKRRDVLFEQRSKGSLAAEKDGEWN